jgi:hypothetical protein
MTSLATHPRVATRCTLRKRNMQLASLAHHGSGPTVSNVIPGKKKTMKGISRITIPKKT